MISEEEALLAIVEATPKRRLEKKRSVRATNSKKWEVLLRSGDSIHSNDHMMKEQKSSVSCYNIEPKKDSDHDDSNINTESNKTHDSDESRPKKQIGHHQVEKQKNDDKNDDEMSVVSRGSVLSALISMGEASPRYGPTPSTPLTSLLHRSKSTANVYKPRPCDDEEDDDGMNRQHSNLSPRSVLLSRSKSTASLCSPERFKDDENEVDRQEDKDICAKQDKSREISSTTPTKRSLPSRPSRLLKRSISLANMRRLPSRTVSDLGKKEKRKILEKKEAGSEAFRSRKSKLTTKSARSKLVRSLSTANILSSTHDENAEKISSRSPKTIRDTRRSRLSRSKSAANFSLSAGTGQSIESSEHENEKKTAEAKPTAAASKSGKPKLKSASRSHKSAERHCTRTSRRSSEEKQQQQQQQQQQRRSLKAQLSSRSLRVAPDVRTVTMERIVRPKNKHINERFDPKNRTMNTRRRKHDERIARKSNRGTNHESKDGQRTKRQANKSKPRGIETMLAEKAETTEKNKTMKKNKTTEKNKTIEKNEITEKNKTMKKNEKTKKNETMKKNETKMHEKSSATDGTNLQPQTFRRKIQRAISFRHQGGDRRRQLLLEQRGTLSQRVIFQK